LVKNLQNHVLFLDQYPVKEYEPDCSMLMSEMPFSDNWGPDLGSNMLVIYLGVVSYAKMNTLIHYNITRYCNEILGWYSYFGLSFLELTRSK
jgi:hypothetical protein